MAMESDQSPQSLSTNLGGVPFRGGGATALSVALLGLEGATAHVEVDVSHGAPRFEALGLAEASLRETRVRVKAALLELGVNLSEYAVTVRFRPSGPPTFGGAFDVPIAIAILAALDIVPRPSLELTLLVGELSVEGAVVQSTRGVLPRLLYWRANRGMRAIVPAFNESEAALVSDIEVRVAMTLPEIVSHLQARSELPRARCAYVKNGASYDDLADVPAWWSLARRALEVAAAGRSPCPIGRRLKSRSADQSGEPAVGRAPYPW